MALSVNAPLFRLSLDPASSFQRDVAKDLEAGKTYEPGTWHLMQELIEPYGRECVDIGAHVGILTCLMCATLRRPKDVVAFEPDGDNRRRLRMNLRINDYSDATVRDEVVCDRDGPVMFFRNADSDGGHSMWNPARSQANWRTREQGGKVRQRIATGVRLDSLNLHPQFVKIDVEGGEYAVLQGAKETIAASRPTVILEINNFGLNALGSDEGQVRQFFRDLSYKEYGIIDEAPWTKDMKPEESMQRQVPVDTGGFMLPVFNMLFVP